jgi:hypothetical protein
MGLDNDFEVGVDFLVCDVGQREAVDVSLVGDEIEIRTDTRFRRVNEAEIANHIHNPEVLVSGRGLHDLLGGRDDDQGRVLDLGADSNNVLRVIGHVARGSLCIDGDTRQSDEDDCCCDCFHALH